MIYVSRHGGEGRADTTLSSSLEFTPFRRPSRERPHNRTAKFPKPGSEVFMKVYLGLARALSSPRAYPLTQPGPCTGLVLLPFVPVLSLFFIPPTIRSYYSCEKAAGVNSRPSYNVERRWRRVRKTGGETPPSCAFSPSFLSSGYPRVGTCA